MQDDLHWLVIPQRLRYKLAVTVHRCLRHRAPRYLADYCVPVFEVAGRQHLRSARCHQLSVPRVRRSTFWTPTLFIAGPRVWNSLLDHLRDPAVDPERFRRDLKTYLFAGHSKRWRITGVT